jgi:hypothetical protein
MSLIGGKNDLEHGDLCRQFHQRSTYSFYARRSQKSKKTLLTLLYFLHFRDLRAQNRTLMKLTPGLQDPEKNQQMWSIFNMFTCRFYTRIRCQKCKKGSQVASVIFAFLGSSGTAVKLALDQFVWNIQKLLIEHVFFI